MQRKTLKALPVFKTEAEERAFWKTHDATDYPDLSKAQPVTLDILKRSVHSDFEQYLSRVPDVPPQPGDEFA